MIPALDPDQESDFQLFGDSGSRFGSCKNRNHNRCRVFMLPALDQDPDSDSQSNGDSESIKKWNHISSIRYVLTAAHCVRSKLGRPAVVLLGEHDLKTECDCDQDQTCNPETQRVREKVLCCIN